MIDAVIANGACNGHDYTGLTCSFRMALIAPIFPEMLLKWSNAEQRRVTNVSTLGNILRKTKHDFSCGGVEIFDSDFGLRLTLDEPEDYVFLQKIAQCLNSHCFSILDVLELHREESTSFKNKLKIIRNEGLLKSKEAYDADW